MPETAFNTVEDVTVMMERVQSHGGKLLFVLLGTPVRGGHHSTTFDVDEDVIRNGAEFFAALYQGGMKTEVQGGKSLGSIHQVQPERSRYRIALTMTSRSCVLGRPVQYVGNIGSKIAHWVSVRSVG